jgi:putrescine---pyruvate transaminase
MPQSAFLHPFARPTATDFLCIVRGQGAVVFDDHGRDYVDAMASLWFCDVGHGRAEIADAVADQLRTLAAFHAFDRFTNAPAEQLAARLAELAPMPDARVFLTTSGSEAVDSALKLVRAARTLGGEPQRRVVISQEGAYHGVTYGGLGIGGLPLNQEHFGPMLPDVVQVPRHDAAAVAQLLAERGDEVAAVVVEPVLGAGGVHPPPAGFLPELRRLCDAAGAWLVLDEVICGFGRLGAMWGAQRYDVQPDVVTFAKGVTSGYVPLGGVLVGAAVRARLEADPAYVLRHGHTYSGHPGACVAALANVDLLEREHLVERVPEIARRLGGGLHALAGDGRVAQVRGEGAVWAAGLADGVDAVAVRDSMIEQGVIARAIGPSTLAFCPPYVITDDQLDRVLAALGAALS